MVNDCPPQAQLWTADPPNEWDAPLWTAAVSSGAAFIVTANLDDGPPPGSDGVQEYEGIFTAHPEVLTAFVDSLVERHLMPEPSLTSPLAAQSPAPQYSRYCRPILSELIRRGRGRARP